MNIARYIANRHPDSVRASLLPTAYSTILVRRTAVALLVASDLALGAGTAFAERLGDAGAGDKTTTSVAEPATSGAPAAVLASKPSIQSSLGGYGDPGGLRAFLASKGIDYSFTYIGEVLSNASGGVKRGATYEGLLNGEVNVDLDKLAGLSGATLHSNFYQIHGRGLSGNNLRDLFTVSTLEAYPSTKLYEAWFEQKLADGKIAVRIGQIGADTEFFVSQTATVFFNPTFGAPAILANDLPSGGPTYPLAAPAVRLKIKPVDNVTLRAALFDGDPAGPYLPGANNPSPQIRDLSGTNFRLGDPPLLIAEATIAGVQGMGANALPGVVKGGYLHHFGKFAATNAPSSLGIVYRGDDSLYGLIDQTIYLVPGTDDQGASVFARGFAAPSDRNLIDVYVDGGIAYEGLIPGRPEDTVGIGAAYARISPDVARFDALAGGPLVRDYQAVIETTYQYAVRPGFSVQAEFQYVFHPGAHGVADPVTGLPIGDTAVLGLRATVQY